MLQVSILHVATVLSYVEHSFFKESSAYGEFLHFILIVLISVDGVSLSFPEDMCALIGFMFMQRMEVTFPLEKNFICVLRELHRSIRQVRTCVEKVLKVSDEINRLSCIRFVCSNFVYTTLPTLK